MLIYIFILKAILLKAEKLEIQKKHEFGKTKY